MGAANECRVVPQLVPLKQQVTAHGGELCTCWTRLQAGLCNSASLPLTLRHPAAAAAAALHTHHIVHPLACRAAWFAPPTLPSLSPLDLAGFDPTAVLHELRQGSLLHPDAPGSITSQYDLQDLIAAARAELRRSQHNQMAQADKAGLAEQVRAAGAGLSFVAVPCAPPMHAPQPRPSRPLPPPGAGDGRGRQLCRQDGGAAERCGRRAHHCHTRVPRRVRAGHGGGGIGQHPHPGQREHGPAAQGGVPGGAQDAVRRHPEERVGRAAPRHRHAAAGPPRRRQVCLPADAGWAAAPGPRRQDHRRHQVQRQDAGRVCGAAHRGAGGPGGRVPRVGGWRQGLAQVLSVCTGARRLLPGRLGPLC